MQSIQGGIRRGSRASALLLGLLAPLAQAQISDDVVKIGVLSDMSSLYSDIGGQGSVIAAQTREDAARQQ